MYGISRETEHIHNLSRDNNKMEDDNNHFSPLLGRFRQRTNVNSPNSVKIIYL
jgi:hypothetical protein